jgi:hypothetical protein
VRRSLPWLASLFAAVLLSTPTYGIGVAVSPLTLIVSWAALKRGTRSSTAARLGVAFNLFLIVAGLTALTTVWGWSAAEGLLLVWIAWGLLVAILLVWSMTLYKRKQPGVVRSDDCSRVL